MRRRRRRLPRSVGLHGDRLEPRLLLANTIAGTVYLDANASGTRDGVGVNPVNGIELGPRGPVVLANSDDGSSVAIPLGFDFEFYGQTFSQAFVNNNGNLTFRSPLGAYIPQGFPRSIPIVAPFWADVDTRGDLGAVHQSTGISPRGRPYFQADWVNVGKYNQIGDRRNDFSVYIEDDPAGDIVAFSYRSMQWTASNSEGAQVGFDSGNGTNYLSFARPTTTADLGYLSNVQFAFRVGPTGTPEPIQMEPGVAGAVVFLDTNGNGTRDVGERFALTEADNAGTATVNEAGRYRFDDLPPGTYTLRQELPAGFVETAPAGGARVVTFGGTDGVSGGQDFGRAQVATVAGRAFEDVNRNGREDAIDGPLAGVTVFLDGNDNGTRDSGEPSATTDATGAFRFDRLPAGRQVIRAMAADGRASVAPADGRQVVTLAASETRTGLDFGFATTVPPHVVDVTPAPAAVVTDGVRTVEVRFDADIDPAARWGGLFELIAAGGDGRFDNGNERPVPLAFEGWDPADRAILLGVDAFLPRDTYRLTATDALVDAVGNRLDGEYRGRLPSGDGLPGGAFVSEFLVVNSPPTSDPYTGRTSQIDPLAVQLTGRDPDGAVTSFRLVQAPQHGTLTPADGLGWFTYTPDPAFAGVDTFRFVASDGIAEGPAADGRVVVARSAVDFVPTALSAAPAAQLTVGRSATISWSVRNDGPGTTLDVGSTDWQDDLYLSADDRLDAGDIRLDRVPIDRAAIGPGGTYSVTRIVTLPFSERSGGAFLLVRPAADGGQLETDVADNVLATAITLRPTIDLVTPPGSFLGRNRPFFVGWRDADQQGSGTITIAIDTDADPANGVGQVVLASGAAEDPDGPADGVAVSLPAGLASGVYYLWARLDGSSAPAYSVPAPVRVFAEAYPGEDSGGTPVGGDAYEVFGVDLAREGDTFFYRVRTNYNPLTNGGDVYVNVGGSFAGGGGRLAGIAVRNRTTETGQPIVAGQLYSAAAFRGGTIRADHPIFVRSYGSAIGGAAMAVATTTPGQPWGYEINGQVSATALGAGPDDSVEIGWGMYCGNDFSATDNDKPRLNLLGAGFVIQDPPDGGQSRPPRRWGDEVTIKYYVVNQGNADVGPTTVRFVVSPDSQIQLDDLGLPVVSGQVDVPALAAGRNFGGEVTIHLPESPPSGFDPVGTIYLGMITDAGNSVAESDETDNFNFALGFDKADLEIGRPHFVNILIHGYDPAPFSYDTMWSIWKGFGERLKTFADESGVASLENNVGVYVTKWESSEGWHSAFIDVAGYAALEVVRSRLTNPLLDLAAEKLQDMFLADAQNSMARAAAFAHAAASRTVTEVLTVMAPGQASLLGPPSEGQWIHVVGHSRGGAVGSEVVRQLRAIGYDVDQYTALDGYSTDWPYPSNILADIDIVGTVARGGADTQINYRVQQGLAALVSSAAEDLIEPYLSRLLGEPVDIGITEAFVERFADWRAPDRPGFLNPVIAGAGSPSNHVTISPQYFDVTARQPFNPYDTLLAAASGGLSARGLMGGPAASAFVVPTSVGVRNTFADGGFDRAGGVRRMLAEIGTIPAFDDPLADTLLRVVRLPGFGVDTSLDVTGDYQVIDDGGNFVLQLGQTNDTRFADLVELTPTANQLAFRYAAAAAGPGDELVVTFDGEPLARYDLDAVSGAGSHAESLDIARFAGRTGKFQFRLAGPTSAPAVVRLDDLAVVAAAADPTELTEGNAAQWGSFAPVDHAATAVSNDTTHVKVGSSSVHLRTESGFDTGVVYPATPGVVWDLSSKGTLEFWAYADNRTPIGFQGDQPVVVLRGPGGSFTYRPATQQIPNRGWKWFSIPLAGSPDWVRISAGAASLSAITSLEIHQDTWDYGFDVYYDGLRFVHAGNGPTLGLIGSKVGDVGQALGFVAVASAPDPAAPFRFRLLGAPGGATIDPITGVFRWTPSRADGPGPFTFRVRVSDGRDPSLFDEESIAVTVRIPSVPEAPRTAIASSSSGPFYGQPLMFTATVSAVMTGLPTPTGAVRFRIDGADFGPPVILSGGVASIAAPATLDAGSHTISVVYSGDTTFAVSTADLPLSVSKATPTLSWANPAAIPAGTPLGAAQLNAAASVPGTFAYTPAAGTVLGAGPGQLLTATFTPNDWANYTPATKSVTIDVAAAQPPIDTTPPTVVGPPRIASKKGSLNMIVIGFSEAIVSAGAGSLGSYRLISAGRDRRFGTRDDKTLALGSAAYREATRTVTIEPRKKVAMNQPLQFVANGSGALVDLALNALDGDHDGRPGGDFTFRFGAKPNGSASGRSVRNVHAASRIGITPAPPHRRPHR
ncbi:MAG: SdrD B-like domain-containing protein [Isosphaeraceae bacterium]